MRASNCAHKYRAGCPLRGAPLSTSAAFGRGGLRPAASFRPACAVTGSRHGEFGASTPKKRCRCLRGGGVNNATRTRNWLALSRSSIDLSCPTLCSCNPDQGSMNRTDLPSSDPTYRPTETRDLELIMLSQQSSAKVLAGTSSDDKVMRRVLPAATATPTYLYLANCQKSKMCAAI